VVESEEALDAEVAAAEDFFVEVSAKFLKIFQPISHEFPTGKGRSSRSTTVARYYERFAGS
jgi:hypothetical protein